MDEDVRWKQRFQNYKKALVTVKNAVDLATTRYLSYLEKLGVIHRFDFTFELAWNVMKDYLKEHGINDIDGSRDAVRSAAKNELVEDGQVWMDMISGRNISSHSYDEGTADKLLEKIIGIFYRQFTVFAEKMEGLT